jgi:hypothetical protein
MNKQTIWLIGLLQVLLIVAGVLGVAIVLKMSGYPQEVPFIRWSSLAIAIRDRGLWLLVVPLVWTTYAIIAVHIERGLWSPNLAGALGVLLMFAILLACLYAAVNPFTRALPIGMFHAQP